MVTDSRLAQDCDPMWDLDDTTYVDYRDRDLLGQHATAHQIVTATTIHPTQEYL